MVESQVLPDRRRAGVATNMQRKKKKFKKIIIKTRRIQVELTAARLVMMRTDTSGHRKDAKWVHE